MAVQHTAFTQKKPTQLVYLELGAGNGGMLLSLSEDGFRFRAVTPVRTEGAIPFAFSLDGKHRLEGVGTIEWLEEDGKSGGMRFTEVSEEFRTALNHWLASDTSHLPAGREATPAAATPLDTMEKIRHELRAGYPQRPAKSARNSDTAEQESPPSPSNENDSDENHRNVGVSHKNVAAAADKNSKKQKFPFSGRVHHESSEPPFESAEPPESKQTQATKRTFPLPPADRPESEKPAASSSAFLKTTHSANSAPDKSVASPPVPASPAFGRRSVAAASSILRGIEPPSSQARSAAQSRSFIPVFEDSFEQAWDHARLSAPPDSPHLTRAASGGIIAIALAVILGALAYNFRQDIGNIFIQLGQSISGENRSANSGPAPQANPPQTNPSQVNPPQANQNTAAHDQQASAQPAQSSASPSAGPHPSDSQSDTQSQKAADSLARSAQNNSAAETPDPNRGAAAGDTPTSNSNGAPGDSTRNSEKSQSNPLAQPSAKSRSNGAQPLARPPSRTAATQTPLIQIPPAAAARGGTADVGEEEFSAARDILSGSNRQRDFSRAVALLWASVKKGNVAAEVTLGDLYRRGQGVPRNCDQARVLLVAASKKGSFEARQLLEKIAEQGCE